MPDSNQKAGPSRLLTRDQLRELIPLAYSTLWEMMRRGEFPKALRIGRQRVAWREDEVMEWLQSRPRQELKPSEEQE